MRFVLVALSLVSCAAHEPPARLHVPDEPARELDAPTAPEAPPPLAAEPVAEPESEPERPVKTVDSPESDAYEQGRRAAQAAIERGDLGLETFGYPAPCRYKYAQILAKDYKVRLHEVAGCVVDSTIVQHARGYNEVMRAEIQRRHGNDVFEKAAAAAGC